MKEMKMSRSLLVAISLFFFWSLMAIACTRQPGLTPGPTTVPVGSESPVKPAWEQGWDKTVEAAKREGSIVVYTGAGTNEIAALRTGLGNAYGISIDSVTGRGAELTEKLLRARGAGLFLADVLMIGSSTTLTLKGAGVLAPLKPLLVLPEVVDPKVWYGGSHIYGDNEGIYTLQWNSFPDASTVVNTDLVKPGEITSNRDLLNTKWKRKIVLNDPTIAGKSQQWFQMVSRHLGIEFMREFAKQEPEINRDQRLQLEWVARGKYPILVGADTNVLAQLIRAGAPLQPVIAPDPLLASTNSQLSFPSKGPAPNAAKVFLNWFLTKEGQTVASKAFSIHSSRLDVPTNHLDPYLVRQPGLIYENAVHEDVVLAQPEAAKQAATIFGLGK
ncbi:MAG: extracellular solute-binding protein [Chloroflexi bacterium]|nr:extracellular solute-binding protein [Chloroflexota bacterium]